MNGSASIRSAWRIALIVMLVLALLVLGIVAAVLFPILTHKSPGGSGQEIPEGYVAESTATGADGRTRTLAVATPEGAPADLGAVVPGEALEVTGIGFDASIGIYVGFCAIPETPATKPGPCLGGIPEGAESGDAANLEGLSSAWVTNDWAWRAFASHRYTDAAAGSFEARLTVPASRTGELDCTVTQCAIVTRADHTAAGDRVQDMLLPIRFADTSPDGTD